MATRGPKGAIRQSPGVARNIPRNVREEVVEEGAIVGAEGAITDQPSFVGGPLDAGFVAGEAGAESIAESGFRSGRRLHFGDSNFVSGLSPGSTLDTLQGGSIGSLATSVENLKQEIRIVDRFGNVLTTVHPQPDLTTGQMFASETAEQYRSLDPAKHPVTPAPSGEINPELARNPLAFPTLEVINPEVYADTSRSTARPVRPQWLTEGTGDTVPLFDDGYGDIDDGGGGGLGDLPGAPSGPERYVSPDPERRARTEAWRVEQQAKAQAAWDAINQPRAELGGFEIVPVEPSSVAIREHPVLERELRSSSRQTAKGSSSGQSASSNVETLPVSDTTTTAVPIEQGRVNLIKELDADPEAAATRPKTTVTAQPRTAPVVEEETVFDLVQQEEPNEETETQAEPTVAARTKAEPFTATVITTHAVIDPTTNTKIALHTMTTAELTALLQRTHLVVVDLETGTRTKITTVPQLQALISVAPEPLFARAQASPKPIVATPKQTTRTTPEARIVTRTKPKTKAKTMLDLDFGSGQSESVGPDGVKNLSAIEYEALTSVRLDLQTGEAESTLLDVSPIDLDFDAPHPPQTKTLATRNLDLVIDDAGRLNAGPQWKREHIIHEGRSTHRGHSKGNGGRGGQEQRASRRR